MKFRWIAIFSIVLILIAFVASKQLVRAQSTVQVTTNNGATYLTTATTTTTPTPTTTIQDNQPATASATASGIIIDGSVIGIPPGFFPSSTVLVNSIFKLIMIVSVLLVFAFLIMGGIEYITSGGDKAKTESARNRIVSAIVGLIIVASSYAILTIVVNFIGFKDVTGLINIGPGTTTTVSPSPAASPTATPSSALKKLIK